MFAEGLEQFRIGGRIGLAHVVLRLDQATVEEVFPVAVRQGTGEETVVLARHPIHQRLTRVVVGGEADRRRAEGGWLDRLFRLFVRGRSIASLVIDNFLAGLRAGLARDLAEERREAVVILLAPF